MTPLLYLIENKSHDGLLQSLARRVRSLVRKYLSTEQDSVSSAEVRSADLPLHVTRLFL